MMQQAAQRFVLTIAAIDEANSKDPELVATSSGPLPHALAYGRWMSEALGRVIPDAGEVLRIAARAQHIERWTMPRSSYAEGRVAYLQWRKDLQKYHARRAGEIMQRNGYCKEDISRVAMLLRKERLKHDADVQSLEDAACLVFLVHEAPSFIARHPDEKVRDILAKTARKMSAAGLVLAGNLALEARLSRLLTEALKQP